MYRMVSTQFMADYFLGNLTHFAVILGNQIFLAIAANTVHRRQPVYIDKSVLSVLKTFPDHRRRLFISGNGANFREGVWRGFSPSGGRAPAASESFCSSE